MKRLRSAEHAPERRNSGPYRRSDFRITSFKPDHTASTAQTLISTSPIGKQISRITSSVTSVATPEAFFGAVFLGHETQIIPSGASKSRSRDSNSASSTFFVTNTCAIARPARGAFTNSGKTPNEAISAATLAGIFDRHVSCPSLTPSFFAKGVPEYPAVGRVATPAPDFRRSAIP